jgi:hypothetical protein
MHNNKAIKDTFVCVIQGFVRGCSKLITNQLRHHHQANMDLYMEYWACHKGLAIKING